MNPSGTSAELAWERDGRDWPNRAASRFVEAGGLRWHVQIMGSGPVVLLLHGTGSSTHSWREFAPLLAARATIVAPDLPGHGFTSAPPAQGMSLEGMRDAVAALLRTLEFAPALAVGHSAGAALAIRMTLDSRLAPRGIVSLNGALLPWRGAPALLFRPLARMAAGSSLFQRWFAGRARDPDAIERFVHGTGSTIDAAGLDCYARLASSPAHVAAVLQMMANWDLAALARDLPALACPLLLVAGAGDRAVPPTEARRAQELVPNASTITLAGLGHLAHEEDPRRVARLVAEFALRVGVPIG